MYLTIQVMIDLLGFHTVMGIGKISELYSSLFACLQVISVWKKVFFLTLYQTTKFLTGPN